MSSTDRFGYEWNKYSELDPRYEGQFRNWVAPLTEKDFQGKSVLDAGSGMGRNSFWALRFGAKELTAFDFDERSVAQSKKNLAVFPNAKVEFKSIYDIKWENQFDLVFSIGVIHHLREPKKALINLVRALKSGGTLVLWVYSKEGNEWIIRYVNPIRKNITSKLPVALVHFLSYFCSVPLFLYSRLRKNGHKYIRELSSFDFWHIHSIVFDQLIPDVANYWSMDDVHVLLRDTGLSEFSIHRPPHDTGWTVIGTKK